MFKNYFKTTIRNLWRNKGTSFINLFGLSVGMTAAVFIFLWVQNEISFDNYHSGKDHIYRITHSIQVNNNEKWVWESSPMLMAEAAIKEIPEVEKTARIKSNSQSVPVFKINNKLFSEKTSAFIDKGWFNMFHYDFVAGNASAFRNPFSIIITKSKAKKYFGKANLIGRIIRVEANFSIVGARDQYMSLPLPGDTAFIIQYVNNKIGYIDVPLLIQYNLNRFYISAGPSLSFRLFSKSALSGGTLYYKSIDVAGNLLAGYQVSKKWDVNIRYSYGLLNINKDPAIVANKKNKYLNISLLYTLNQAVTYNMRLL